MTAVFAVDTHTVAPSAGTNGSISPAAAQTVAHGADSTTFTVTPAAGYTVADVLVDGVSIGAVTAHKFTNVVSDHTIAATFELKFSVGAPKAPTRVKRARSFTVYGYVKPRH